MQVTGYVTGDRANKYIEYSYRVPIQEDLTVYSIYPNRLNFMNEYPRDTAIYLGNKTETIANFKITFHGVSHDDYMGLIDLKMIPNRYTVAKKEKTVASFKALNGDLHFNKYKQEIFDLAFN